MESLDRRLARLEGSAGAWTLTRILEWIANPIGSASSGALADCGTSLPVSVMNCERSQA